MKAKYLGLLLLAIFMLAAYGTTIYPSGLICRLILIVSAIVLVALMIFSNPEDRVGM